MRTDAIFPLASMTKPIASVAAMQLIEQGHVLLTGPLHSILPPFRDAKVLTIHGLEPARSPITLLDLLRHTAGIGAVNLYPNSPIAKIYAEARVSDPEQTLAACIDALAALPLMHQLGTIWDYSDFLLVTRDCGLSRQGPRESNQGDKDAERHEVRKFTDV
jgi:CubicO group peptidase (beta-lactamase class C family)